MRRTPILAATLVLAAVASTASAQDKEKDKDKDVMKDERVIVTPKARISQVYSRSPRAMIGVSTSSSGERDTLGLLITAITPGGPAEKAGIVEGNRIASINGVNLRLSAADAGEEDMNGIVSRRLTRELGKLDPGAEVELRVWADGQFRNVRLRTISSDSLGSARFRTVADARRAGEDRAVLGIEVNATGSRRDTLGILINTVSENGPAEKAGLVEGDRIASINGTDLRVRGEDVGDDEISGVMVSRFQRVMRGVKAGDRVELRIVSGGQSRTVTVQTGRAADVYKDRDGRFRMFMPTMDFDGPAMAPMPPMPPMPAVPAVPAVPRVRVWSGWMDEDDDVDDDEDDATDVEIEQARSEAARAKAEADAFRQELLRTREDVKRANEEISRQRALERAPRSTAWNGVMVTPPAEQAASAQSAEAAEAAVEASGYGALAGPRSNIIHVRGLRVAAVTPELAEYLGKGSTDGYLVLESEGAWKAVHAGDVLLSVDGTCVKSAALASLDPERAREAQVLRNGKRMTVRLVGG